MLELGLLAVTAGAAAKITAIILGSIIGLYFLFALIMTWGCNKWGLEFFCILFGIGRIVLGLGIAFAVIFLLVMGIGALI